MVDSVGSAAQCPVPVVPVVLTTTVCSNTYSGKSIVAPVKGRMVTASSSAVEVRDVKVPSSSIADTLMIAGSSSGHESPPSHHINIHNRTNIVRVSERVCV